MTDECRTTHKRTSPAASSPRVPKKSRKSPSPSEESELEEDEEDDEEDESEIISTEEEDEQEDPSSLPSKTFPQSPAPPSRPAARASSSSSSSSILPNTPQSSSSVNVNVASTTMKRVQSSVAGARYGGAMQSPPVNGFGLSSPQSNISSSVPQSPAQPNRLDFSEAAVHASLSYIEHYTRLFSLHTLRSMHPQVPTC
jgi:hypothetical protein